MKPGDSESLVMAMEHLIERLEKELADPEEKVLEVAQARFAIREYRKESAARAKSQRLGGTEAAWRDHFAGQAMQALLPIYDATLNFDLCKRAYKVADAMLEARKQ